MENALIVIPKDKAAFRMDGNGRWHNRDGPFRHKNIIDGFNASIQRDGKGYFITQERGRTTEKVYFPYERTALFVVDILWGTPDKIRLNTGSVMALNPECLFIHEDQLYCRLGDEIAKFQQRALLEISDKLSCDGRSYYFMAGPVPIALAEEVLTVAPKG